MATTPSSRPPLGDLSNLPNAIRTPSNRTTPLKSAPSTHGKSRAQRPIFDDIRSTPLQSSPGRIHCECCQTETLVRHVVIFDECNHCACSKCVEKTLETEQSSRCPVCRVDVAPRALGPVFDSFLERKFEELVNEEPSNADGSVATKQYVRCPNSNCRMVIERLPSILQTAGEDAHSSGHKTNSRKENFSLWHRLKNCFQSAAQKPAPPVNPVTAHLDAAHEQHYSEHRFRCRGCMTEFCAGCGTTPYHLGYSCEEFRALQAAPKCRWCKEPVLPQTSDHPCENTKRPSVDEHACGRPPLLPRPSCEQTSVAEDVTCCSSHECKVRSKLACSRTLDCGHCCGGIRGEASHLSCMECNSEQLGCCGDDLCSICWTEPLNSAPSIQLKCGHVFHYQCIRKRVQKGWHTAHISFSFLSCPLCKKDVEHDALDKYLAPYYRLRSDVKSRALQRAAVEGVQFADDEDPLQHFMYYMCAECEQPYFGGLRSCMIGVDEEVIDEVEDESSMNSSQPLRRLLEGGKKPDHHVDKNSSKNKKGQKNKQPKKPSVWQRARSWWHRKRHGHSHENLAVPAGRRRINRKELICGSCAAGDEPNAVCEKHGRQYIEYKCKFCCNVASWYCWGNTHFCDTCHSRQERGDYVTRVDPKTLPKCPGPRFCPIQMKHPPPGEEFLMGCAVCRDKSKF